MISIREERPSDFGAVYELVKTAFLTAKVSDGDEQEFVNTLRKRGGYVPGLALVMECDGIIIGHVMLTRLDIKGARREIKSLLLAPLCVALEHRNSGLGSILAGEAARRAAELGFDAVLLVGDPAYYHRLGYRSIAAYGISCENGIPDQYAMALELYENALEGVGGSVRLE